MKRCRAILGIKPSNINNIKVIEITVAKNKITFPIIELGIRLNNAISQVKRKKIIV